MTVLALLALGNELGKLGRRVLLIDMDPQANLTFSCGYDTAQIATSIYEALLQPDKGVAPMTLHTARG